MHGELKSYIKQLKKFYKAPYDPEEEYSNSEKLVGLLENFNWKVAKNFIDQYLKRCSLKGIMDHMMWQST